MTAERANDCIFVSSGNYTAEARLFAEDKPIWLIDGSELLDLVSSVQVQPSISKPSTIKEHEASIPSCPLCGSDMVKRTAKKVLVLAVRFGDALNFQNAEVLFNSEKPQAPSIIHMMKRYF